MSLSDFWKQLADSRLLSAAQAERLAADFEKERPPSEQTTKAAAQWLMDLRAISKYHANVLLAGKTGPFFVGEYKIYERIDKGRLAGCFRALHNASKYCVILRFATGSLLKDPQQWAAASANAALATQITSPFVQRCFEAVDLTRFKFIVSDDVRGATLEEALASGKTAPAEACRLMRQAALGLAAMHAAGRAHGDLRPGNIVLETIGNQPPSIKLLYDAAELPSALDISQLQEGGRAALLADYFAPELLVAGRAPDKLSDIYGLGSILYVLLAGQPPFAGGDVQQKLKRQLSEPARPLETMGVPQPLAQLVSYLTAKNPSVRYQSAAQVADQLALFVPPAQLSNGPPPPPSSFAAYEQYLRQKLTSVAKSPARPQPQPIPVAAAVAAEPIAATRPQGNDEPTQALGVLPPASDFRINTQPSPRAASTVDEISRRRKAQQQRNLLLGIAGIASLVLISLVGGLLLLIRNKPATTTVAKVESTATATVTPDLPKTAGDEAAKATTPEGNDETSAAGNEPSAVTKPGGSSVSPLQQVVNDDGKLLWASPTRGQPISFRCVPPEGQVFIIIRPAEMLANEEGRRVIAALGPAVRTAQAAFEKASGCKFDEIEQLHITLHDNAARFPRVSYVVKTIKPLTKLDLLGRWGDPEVTKDGDDAYYAGPGMAYYLPKAVEDDRTFAMGEARDMKDVAAAGGSPPFIYRDIERLRRLTDADRHFTLLFYPQFLSGRDGGPLFAGERAKLRDPLDWLLGDDVQAACVSAHFTGEFYLEARLRPSLDKELFHLSKELQERLDTIPGSLEDYFVTLSAPPYWKKLAFRYPGMVRELRNQLRLGVENDMVVVNAILPIVAAHNLVLGGELLMSTAPGQAVSVASTGSAAPASGPKTVAEALQMKTSYSFDNQSLEFAMRDLADDVKSNLKSATFEFAIKIIGDDLKLDGITRNQSIRDFKQENQTVADILTALVRKANPVTTVKDPSEKDQKLVWCVGPDPDGPGKQVVLITTRNAANAKKYALPPNFVEKGKK